LERRAISITQACESVGVSRRTIYNWMAAGKVQYVRTAGGAVRIFEDSLWRAPEAVLVQSNQSHRDEQQA
jgi:excisionase family DNA binding protein